MSDVERDLHGLVLREADVHQDQRAADGERRNHDADDQADLLPERRGADKVAGLQILRRGARDRRGDANDAANRQREHAVGVGRPAERGETPRRWPSASRWSCR